MTFWVPAAALALLAVLVILLPLWRRSGATVGHREGALAIFVDQLREIEAERNRGLISPAEAAAAQIEIKRRMLAVERQGRGGPVGTGGAPVLMGLAVLVPLLAGAVYVTIGAPGAESLPFVAREAERTEDRKIVDLTEQLRNRLLTDEAGGPTEGWELLAQTYMKMGRYAAAAEALGRIVDREDAHSGHLTQWAEALIAANDGVITTSAGAAIDRALAMDVLNPAASYYKAQWLEQDGRAGQARELLLLRLEQESDLQPWMEIFVQQANRIGAETGAEPVALGDFVNLRGPSAEDVEAAQEMTAEERDAFIRSMVAGLAARLEDAPDDLDGWLQLGRAYGVLGERALAAEAYRAAEGLLDGLPAEDPRRQVVAQGLAEFDG
ncbi:c-type cytochrome biogenesis protein CcmI [Marinovum sp.]|uniref:c-type cytochrome biogenesis protein CcmI n=1 Tax=Marinovum sp. TaxID=2024839 RepID=UPI002B27B50C|nr:c-type cytochrome biogenesis protein CcmI [Marinovum sp.]